MTSNLPEVDAFLKQSADWRDELTALRGIVLECGLTEAWKWRAPCYTVDDGNVVILGRLKDGCTLSFFKGALLKDPKHLLEKPGPNTQAARVMRFTDVSKIKKLTPTLKALIREAAALEKSGAKVETGNAPKLDTPDELQSRFDEDPAFHEAFEALTPGRQRAYLMHFAAAKQSATRASRIDKCTARILDGKGLNDCTCGLSKRMPACDGSHKYA